MRDDKRCGTSKEYRTPEVIDQRVSVRVTLKETSVSWLYFQ